MYWFHNYMIFYNHWLILYDTLDLNTHEELFIFEYADG